MPATGGGFAVESYPSWLADFTSCDLTARLDSALGTRLQGGVYWERTDFGILLDTCPYITQQGALRRQKGSRTGERLDVLLPVMMLDIQIPVSVETQIL